MALLASLRITMNNLSSRGATGGLHLQCESCCRISVVRTVQGCGLKGCRMGVLANLCKFFHEGKAQHIM